MIRFVDRGGTTPEAFDADATRFPVGRGDIVTFSHRGHRVTGVVVKVNPRSVRVRHPEHDAIFRTLPPERVVHIDYMEATDAAQP